MRWLFSCDREQRCEAFRVKPFPEGVGTGTHLSQPSPAATPSDPPEGGCNVRRAHQQN